MPLRSELRCRCLAPATDAGPDLDRALDALVENALRYSPSDSAVTIAAAAANLASRQIGLASEPVSAGEALAPATGSDNGHGTSRSGSEGNQTQHSSPTTTPTTPETPEIVPTTPPTNGDTSHDSSDDSGGSRNADD